MFHVVHIAVYCVNFGLGEVKFFNKGVGFCVVFVLVCKTVARICYVTFVVFEVYLPVMSNLSAEMEKFLVHGAVAGGFNGYVLAGFILAVDIAYISFICAEMNLDDQIVAEREENERLDIQLSASAEREAELTEKVGALIKRDTVLQDKIKILSGGIKELAATNRRIAEERDSCMGELESVRNSLSFKLGRFITFIPRKIRDVFKKKK